MFNISPRQSENLNGAIIQSTSVIYGHLIKLQESVNQLNTSVHQQTEIIDNQRDKIVELEDNINSVTTTEEQKYAQIKNPNSSTTFRLEMSNSYKNENKNFTIQTVTISKSYR